MSQAAYDAFKARLATDEALSSEFSRTFGTSVTADDLVAFGRRHGYEFDRAVVERGFELSEAELNAVAGGTMNRSSPSLMLACASGQHIKEATISMK